jgi:hypothetical protein
MPWVVKSAAMSTRPWVALSVLTGPRVAGGGDEGGHPGGGVGQGTARPFEADNGFGDPWQCSDAGLTHPRWDRSGQVDDAGMGCGWSGGGMAAAQSPMRSNRAAMTAHTVAAGLR